MTIDIQKTINKSNGRITKAFLAKTLGRPPQTIHNWIKTGKIPYHSVERLIAIFQENNIEPEFL